VVSSLSVITSFDNHIYPSSRTVLSPYSSCTPPRPTDSCCEVDSCPNHTKLSIRFQLWNLLGIMFVNKRWPITFHTITSGYVYGWCLKRPVWSAPHPICPTSSFRSKLNLTFLWKHLLKHVIIPKISKPTQMKRPTNTSIIHYLTPSCNSSYSPQSLQGLGCLIWQKIDKPLSTVLSIRRPWFGHLVDNFLSYLLSYRTKIHVGYIVTIPRCHVGSTQPCQHFHLCVNFFLLVTCPPSYTSKKM
jgi:hypothetical protein